MLQGRACVPVLVSVLLASACGGNVSSGNNNGGGGSTNATGGGGTATTATGGTTTATGGTTTATGGGTSTGCATDCGGFTCCGTTCRNLDNDILNCGACGNVCPADKPYCNFGTCDTPPCMDGTMCNSGETCCLTQCCTAGQLCCTVNMGPLVTQCTQATSEGTCPTGCDGCVCMPPDTSIATPGGERAIAALEVGDLVYSVHEDALRAVPILRTSRTPVRQHHVVRVVLSNGAVLEASARHPTADGRMFADLAAGDRLNELPILEVSTVPYPHAFTYDILPASDTGTYVAGGVIIGSTLHGKTRALP